MKTHNTEPFTAYAYDHLELIRRFDINKRMMRRTHEIRQMSTFNIHHFHDIIGNLSYRLIIII